MNFIAIDSRLLHRKIKIILNEICHRNIPEPPHSPYMFNIIQDHCNLNQIENKIENAQMQLYRGEQQNAPFTYHIHILFEITKV